MMQPNLPDNYLSHHGRIEREIKSTIFGTRKIGQTEITKGGLKKCKHKQNVYTRHGQTTARNPARRCFYSGPPALTQT